MFKILANESHNDKLKLIISKKPRKMQLEFNEPLNFDDQNSNHTKTPSFNNNNGVYVTGSCKTTAL